MMPENRTWMCFNFLLWAIITTKWNITESLITCHMFTKLSAESEAKWPERDFVLKACNRLESNVQKALLKCVKIYRITKHVMNSFMKCFGLNVTLNGDILLVIYATSFFIYGMFDHQMLVYRPQILDVKMN